MKRVLLALSSAVALSVPATAMAQLDSLVAGNTALALSLYNQLSTNAGNIFFSPYSISTCLGMLYAGARGNTEQQMSEVLGFSTNQQQFSSTFGDLQRELETNQEPNMIELNIANALWTQAGFPFLPAFLQTATNQFQASISNADFETPAGDASATQTINEWVAQETRNRIQNLIPSGAVTPETKAVLANAIYFLGAWTTCFQETNTSTQPFYLSSTSTVDAPLMHQPAESVFYSNLGHTQPFPPHEPPPRSITWIPMISKPWSCPTAPTGQFQC